MKLVYDNTGKKVKVGDRIDLEHDGSSMVDYFVKPHKPASSGKVTIVNDQDQFSTYYVGVIGATWIDREGRE